MFVWRRAGIRPCTWDTIRAGGMIILLLLVSLVVTVTTGLLVLGGEPGTGVR